MASLDFKKKYKTLYSPSAKEFVIVEVPSFNFLMIDGQGDPNTFQSYMDAMQALYSISYALKFSMKKTGGPQYSVPPLEGLWWADDMSNFAGLPKSA